ncbi:transposase [Chryseobacterium gallinarum]|uniref:Transposase n=1 Tax=Chryseobacterium gallinarum TaxID=1324352 RepID=A0ABX6KP57_CHRGL|nr:transposase [Chryseobacterium gallinarum]QIY90252.1 transposase [Chryseobacterium gallinarum]
MNLKEIHIGKLIQIRTDEKKLDKDRICSYLKCTEDELERMYEAKSMSSELLLKWSKLLEYDFFRIYSQHLIFYSPPAVNYQKKGAVSKNPMPQFRKNIYTSEIIEFILDLISSGAKTKQQIITEYRIPKTTLYKWVEKYSSSEKKLISLQSIPADD